MKNFFISIVFLLLFSGCSNEGMSKLPENSVIVAFGDSLTYGYGVAPQNSYPKVLGDILKMKVINEGVNGDTTEDGLKRINEVLEEHKPSLILIGLGGNDMLKRLPEEQIKANLNQLIEISKQKGVKVVLLATPRPVALGLVIGVNDAPFYSEIAQANEVPLIESVYSEWLSDEEYKSDPIHLNEKGYAKVAEQIADFLKKNGAI